MKNETAKTIHFSVDLKSSAIEGGRAGGLLESVVKQLGAKIKDMDITSVIVQLEVNNLTLSDEEIDKKLKNLEGDVIRHIHQINY